MKKLVSLLLVMVLVLALVPMTASAHNIDYIRVDNGNTTGKPYYYIGIDGKQVGVTQKEYDVLLEAYKKCLIQKEEDFWASGHEPNDHAYRWERNAKYHWLYCPCGCKISMAPHVDPLETEDDICICGLKFSDNTDLVTLWVKNCPPIKNFNKNTTEYTLNAYTYKDVKEIEISTRTFDDFATVELPEDLTLKEGENTFEIKVIAPNKKATKTYTLTVIKEAK